MSPRVILGNVSMMTTIVNENWANTVNHTNHLHGYLHILSVFSRFMWSTLLAKSNGRFFVLDFWKLSNRRNVFNLETIKTDKSTLILQNKNWCQMINPMCTTFQMWQNCILQNQVCFERLISLSNTPYIFVKISNPRNWDPYSFFAMSHGNRTSSYETVTHKLRPSVAAVHSSPKVMAVSSNIKMSMLDLLNFYDI